MAGGIVRSLWRQWCGVLLLGSIMAFSGGLLLSPSAFAAQQIIASSDQDDHKAIYIPFQRYTPLVTRWPSGCGGAYKPLPWEAGGEGRSSAGGNDIARDGNCSTPAQSGGTSAMLPGYGIGGAWVNTTAFGNWVSPAADDSFWATPARIYGINEACVTTYTTNFKGTPLENRSQLWGTGCRDDGDKTSAVRQRNPNFGVSCTYSNGSTLFRKHFMVDDPARIQSMRLRIIGDDWFAAFINGQYVAGTALTSGYVELNIPTTALLAGDNLLAIQVADKIVVAQNAGWCAPGGRASALVYDLVANVPDTPPPPPTPSGTVSCGGAATPSDVVLLGRLITLKPSVIVTGRPVTPSTDPTFKMWVRAPGQPANAWGTYPLSYTTSPGVSGTVLTASYDFTPLVAGTYDLQWRVEFPGEPTLNVTCPGTGVVPGGGGSGPDWPGRDPGGGTTDQVKAGYRPYFDVMGGDIRSGDGIRSWNLGGSDNYVGAGSQIAALATGSIQDFVTGGGLAGGRAIETGSGLTFANDTSVKTASTYGGKYTVQSLAMPTLPVSGTTTVGGMHWQLNSVKTSGAYVHTGNITVAGTLSKGVRATLYVKSGTVTISGDITYDDYGSSLQDIPRLTVYVLGGDMYVDSSVREMHGAYSVNGSFYSCTEDNTSPNYFTQCSNKLTVYGAVAAQKLVLRRTHGNVVRAGAVPNSPAETFMYTPELWLAPPADPPGGTQPVTYNSYISLPPIL